MKKFMDEEFKTFLNNVISADQESDESVPEWLQEGMERDGNGEENSCPDELCVSDITVECKPRYLKDHLPIFAPAEEIIKMEKVFKEKPELRNAERSEGECEGGCDSCKDDSGRARSTEQEKKDK
jgi:hypothetical protein